MSDQCEHCAKKYSVLKRKKSCSVCQQSFCSKCSPRSALLTPRVCILCVLIGNPRTTEQQLSEIKTKHLRAFLIGKKVESVNFCLEKQDLINLIINDVYNGYVFVETSSSRSQLPSQTFSTSERTATASTTDSSNISTLEPNVNNEQVPNVATNPSPVVQRHSPRAVRRKSLKDIHSEETIDSLSVKELKELLTFNFVEYRGCVEKQELILKVKHLFRDHQTQKEQVEQLDNPNQTATTTTMTTNELCKVCMDAMIDCVFLDCGHLCTCVKCGKLLSECPICRCFIVRVVRVFKS